MFIFSWCFFFPVLYMEYNDSHTNTCVLTAPDAYSAYIHTERERERERKNKQTERG